MTNKIVKYLSLLSYEDKTTVRHQVIIIDVHLYIQNFSVILTTNYNDDTTVNQICKDTLYILIHV